jgi:hypothetical protein
LPLLVHTTVGACFKRKKNTTTEINTTDLLARLTHFPFPSPLRFPTFPIRQSCCFSWSLTKLIFFFSFTSDITSDIESVRGVNTGRTHDAQGNKLVFQRMVVRQWLERTARGRGRYGVCRIILVFSSATGTSGARR